MDTDDLSRKAYNAVIIEAEKLSHDLAIQFGVLSSRCREETEYLKRSKQLANEIKQLVDFGLEDLLFGNVPEKNKLNYTLNRIINNIEQVNKIPMNKRYYDF
jgi:hypothetical protein